MLENQKLSEVTQIFMRAALCKYTRKQWTGKNKH